MHVNIFYISFQILRHCLIAQQQHSPPQQSPPPSAPPSSSVKAREFFDAFHSAELFIAWIGGTVFWHFPSALVSLMKLKLRVGRKVQGTFRSQDTYKPFVSHCFGAEAIGFASLSMQKHRQQMTTILAFHFDLQSCFLVFGHPILKALSFACMNLQFVSGPWVHVQHSIQH